MSGCKQRDCHSSGTNMRVLLGTGQETIGDERVPATGPEQAEHWGFSIARPRYSCFSPSSLIGQGASLAGGAVKDVLGGHSHCPLLLSSGHQKWVISAFLLPSVPSSRVLGSTVLILPSCTFPGCVCACTRVCWGGWSLILNLRQKA